MLNNLFLSLVVLALTNILFSCDGGGSAPTPLIEYTDFSNPELVAVINYSGEVMEPFISRDGVYLFFNDNGSDKDIFYATYFDDITFQFQGAITDINTPKVEGVPTMDVLYNFYYVSTNNYDPSMGSYDTLYTGTWTGTTVTDSTAVVGLAITTPGFINFDIEVSSDGTTLYFDDGDFRGGNSFPDTANIVIAVNSTGSFVRDPNSAATLATVNTSKLEYAPGISSDGLELFFTRLDQNTLEAQIYRAARSNISDPFGPSQRVSVIDSFAEGPSLSPDQKSLYYHRKNTSTNLFELYRVTRP